MRKNIQIHSTQILRIAKFWIVMSALIAIDGYGIFLLTGFNFLEHEVVRSVCEDVEQHFAFWQEAVNNNRKDCCNLKI